MSQELEELRHRSQKELNNLRQEADDRHAADQEVHRTAEDKIVGLSQDLETAKERFQADMVAVQKEIDELQKQLRQVHAYVAELQSAQEETKESHYRERSQLAYR